ncbi:methyltransferase [Microbacterium lacus]|uniref:class I SAM-dependent methyltransferase n=1 Tax=Microbacterium lacus TaxID=415217 RepID=UPI00384D3896
MTFSPDAVFLSALRRWPDVEAPDLVAVDAADRLILDEATEALSAAGAGEVVVIADAYGALTLSAARSGVTALRVHQDPLTGERALAANAELFGLSDAFRSLPLSARLLTGARLVLVRLPRSLDALRDIAGLIAAHAHPHVVIYAGGRLKHMTPAMNDVLREHFDRVDVTHARQKSRVLIARGPHTGAEPSPRRAVHDGLVVCAFGGVFAGTAIDIGTRFLLEHVPATIDGAGDIIDLACGTGVVATRLALQHPERVINACDDSAAAVESARATAAANGVADRVTVVRDDMLTTRADASARLITLNPPFHSGAAVHEGIAPRMFADASRVLRPGGELWTVWNSSLQYRPALERIVGPTRQVARNAKFTVTVSTRRAD